VVVVLVLDLLQEYPILQLQEQQTLVVVGEDLDKEARRHNQLVVMVDLAS